jgi:uncharacterized membrane protein SirB2
MGRRDTASLRPGSKIWVRTVSSQSSVVSNIKQTVVIFIYIQQQITSCVRSYILQVLLLWQKYITWTLTLLLRFIRQVNNSVCKQQYWKKCTPPLSDKLLSYCTASHMPFFSESPFYKTAKYRKPQIQYRPTLLLYGAILETDAYKSTSPIQGTKIQASLFQKSANNSSKFRNSVTCLKFRVLIIQLWAG